MIENARAAILRSPRKSARRHSRALGISDRSFRRILHQDFNFHPYKLQIAHELKPQDLVARKQFCTTMCDLLRENPQIRAMWFCE
jgi:hypothetical protein